MTCSDYYEKYYKLDAVKTLVDKSASIRARDKDDCTPLHYAALGGQLEAARFLVDKGADINAVCHADRGKPIHIAAMEGHENVIEFFISKGINVNDVATGNGRTPLHYAAWQGKLDAVKTLVDKSASIGARDKDDCTPLHYAALGGQLEAARFLVDKGADINAICHIDCRKPIHVAAMKGHKNVIEFFLSKGMSVNGVATENGWTPLHYAAWQGHLEAARFLVDRGADINAVETSAEGKKPIHVAAEGNNKNIIEFLLSKGVSVNDTDKEGWTPLHWAARNDCLEAARLLVDRGADINAESSGGTTPLEMAETWSGSEIVNFLKAKKQSEYDYRLLAAVKSGNVSEVTDLLNRGANIEAKDEEGWTPLHWAAWIGHLEIASFLVDRRANISAADTSFNGGKPIHVAARGNNKNIIEFLLSKGVSVNDTDKEGWTPLHWAAWSSSLEAASFLVDRGANINAESIRGTTPLGMVETWGGQEIADFLRGKQNEYNLLLFDAAKNGDFDKVKDLTARGADVKAKDNNGKTPQDVAADKEHSNIVKYLEEKLNEERGKPVHRKRRHHHGDHPRHYNRSSRKLPATDLSNQTEVAASSGARPSSWINDLFSWAREKGSLLVSGIVNSVWPASVAKLSKETSYGSTTKNNLEPIDYSQIDMNGTILLIDTFIRKITGQKYVSSNTRSIPEQEVLGYVLSITEGFEKVVEQAAKDSKISIHRLGIDFMGMHKEITGKIMGGKFDEVSGILNSYVEKACPDREAGCPGKLSSKKFDKFMNALNNRLDLVLNQSMKQILSRNSRLEASDVKEQQISLEPKSYLNNTSVQSYLTQARDSRLR